MRSCIVIFLCFFNILSFAQKQSSIWYFGYHGGLDFSNGRPEVITGGQTGESIVSSSAISDSNGNFLFYTDGYKVWNRLHQVMPNGYLLYEGNTLIVPKPGNDQLFYIFVAIPSVEDTDSAQTGFRFSVVDMGLEGGLGDVVEKNTLLFRNPDGNMTAVYHGNKTDVWLVTNESNNNVFRSYKIAENGIESSPVINSIGEINISSQIKLSPDGKKLAIASSLFNNSDAKIQILDFDNQTGLLSDPITIPYSKKGSFIIGLEFSPTSNYLYFTDSYDNCGSAGISYLLQVETQSSNQTPTIVGTYAGALGIMQLALDGKIYISDCSFNDNHFLDCINFPTRNGSNCKFSPKEVDFAPGRYTNSGPTLINFIQSYFVVGDPVIEMPNVFTPNEGDTLNARFRPITFSNINFTALTIIDRWGLQVFYTEDLPRGWDGGNQPEGVYYWFVRYDGRNGESGAMKGWVQLIRS